MEIEQFLEKVASDTPTPGGGSVSALAGALSASLVAMVTGLSLKKSKFLEKELKEISKKSLMIQKRLLRAVEEDAKSYEAVLKAFRLPKNTERERSYRSQMIQKAYQGATVTPRLVCELSIQLLEYSKALIFKGNPNAMSDAGVAAFLADAAISGGLLNIRINLIPSMDRRFIKEMNSLMKKYERRKSHLLGNILKLLN